MPSSRGETVFSTLRYMYRADFWTFTHLVTGVIVALMAALAEMPAAACLALALSVSCYICGKRQIAISKLKLKIAQQDEKLTLFYRDLKLREQELRRIEK